MSTATIPAGWYNNPSAPGERYWDGGAWTDQVRAFQPPPPPPAQPTYAAPSAPAQAEKADGIVAAGYVFAVLMPIVGFILGIVAATRPSKATSKHGVWIIVVSVVAFVIFLAIISSNSTSSYSSY